MSSGALPATKKFARRAATAVALLGSACRAHGETIEATRAEAGSVAHAVESLRNAPNATKAPLLAALRNAPCTASDVCQLRDACASAYARELGALDGLRAVRRAAGQTDAPVPSSAVEVLSRAQADLERALGDETACADSEAAIERKYSL